MIGLGRAFRPLVRAAYQVKRRYAIGDRFLARHVRIAEAVMGLLRPFKEHVVVDVHGHLLELDPGDYLGLSIMREYEVDVTSFLRRSVRSGDTALDLGAHIGYFTLLLAKLVGPEGRVVAFEPDPDNFLLLERNVASNGYSNVMLRQAAVSDRSGRAPLFRSDSNPGDHRLFGEAASRSSIEVDVVALDEALPCLHGMVRWIKMDVQGAELHALRGMQSLVKSCTPLTVVAEFMPEALAAADSTPQQLLGFFEELGFETYRVERGGLLAPVALHHLVARVRVQDGTYTNLVFERTG